MNIIIVGCGKVGSTIAKQLCNEGYDVTVIDNNPNKKTELCRDGNRQIRKAAFHSELSVKIGKNIILGINRARLESGLD